MTSQSQDMTENHSQPQLQLIKYKQTFRDNVA